MPGSQARLGAVAAIVQQLHCGGYHRGSAAVWLIVSDLVYLDDAPKGKDGRPGEEESLKVSWRAACGMLYVEDAGVVSTSPRGLARMMSVIVVVYQELELTERKRTKAIYLWSNPSTALNALRSEEAGKRYRQITKFVYLSGGAINEGTYLVTEIRLRIGAAWASVRRYSSQLYEQRDAAMSLKIRLLKAKAVEAMLYGCAAWIVRSQNFGSLRTTHHKLRLRVIGFRRKDRTRYRPLS